MDLLKKIESIPAYLLKNQDSVVLFTTIKYYRNLKGYNFPTKLEPAKLNEVKSKATEIIQELPIWDNSPTIIETDSLTSDSIMVLYERGVIGHESLKLKNISVIFESEEKIVIRINEREHLKFIFRSPYQDLSEVASESQLFLSILDKALDFSYRDSVGYLNSSPRYLGHGLSVSAMLHVPATFMVGELSRFTSVLQKNFMVLTGFLDTNMQTYGAFVQIKLASFFNTSSTVFETVSNTLNELRELENQTRNAILVERPIEVEDKIFKSLAILQNAKILSLPEAIEHISNVKMGTDLGFVKEIHPNFFAEAFFRIFPYHVKVYYALSEDEPLKEAEMRALLVQELLEKYQYGR